LAKKKINPEFVVILSLKLTKSTKQFKWDFMDVRDYDYSQPSSYCRY